MAKDPKRKKTFRKNKNKNKSKRRVSKRNTRKMRGGDENIVKLIVIDTNKNLINSTEDMTKGITEDMTNDQKTKKMIKNTVAKIKEIIDREVAKISYLEEKYESQQLDDNIDGHIRLLQQFLDEIIKRRRYLDNEHNNEHTIHNKDTPRVYTESTYRTPEQFYALYEKIEEKDLLTPKDVLTCEFIVRNTYTSTTFDDLIGRIKNLIKKLEDLKTSAEKGKTIAPTEATTATTIIGRLRNLTSAFGKK